MIVASLCVADLLVPYQATAASLCLCLLIHFKPPLVHILTSRFCQACRLFHILVNVAGYLVTQFKDEANAVNIRQCCPSARHEGSFSTFSLSVGAVTFAIQYPLTNRLCGPWNSHNRESNSGYSVVQSAALILYRLNHRSSYLILLKTMGVVDHEVRNQ